MTIGKQMLDKVKWQGIEPSTVNLERVSNGWTIGVFGTLPERDPASGSKHIHDVFVFKTDVEAGDFVRKCLCGDKHDAGAEPSSAKFPNTFIRFDGHGPNVRAVLYELKLQIRYKGGELEHKIDRLKRIHLDADELAPWENLLCELRRLEAIALAAAAETKEHVGT